VREKGVAQEHAQGIAPACIQGWLATTAFAFIHYVVVHESCEMNQLHNYCQIDVRLGNRARGRAGQESNQRSHPFPTAVQCVANVTFDRWIECLRLLGDTSRDLVQLRLHH
jgi:hypothetical protein